MVKYSKAINIFHIVVVSALLILLALNLETKNTFQKVLKVVTFIIAGVVIVYHSLLLAGVVKGICPMSNNSVSGY